MEEGKERLGQIYPHLLITAKEKLREILDEKSRRKIDAMKSQPSVDDIQDNIARVGEWAQSMNDGPGDVMQENTLSIESTGRQKKSIVAIDMTFAKDKMPHNDKNNNRTRGRFDADAESKGVECIQTCSEHTFSRRYDRTRKRLEHEIQEIQNKLGIEKLSESEKLFLAKSEKNKGNENYKCEEFEEAVSCYTKSLAYNQDNAVLFANRGMASVKLGNNDQAFVDCCKSLEIDPSYTKALARRAMIHHACGRYFEAAVDFEECMRREPENQSYLKLHSRSISTLEDVSGNIDRCKDNCVLSKIGKRKIPTEVVRPEREAKVIQNVEGGMTETTKRILIEDITDNDETLSNSEACPILSLNCKKEDDDGKFEDFMNPRILEVGQKLETDVEQPIIVTRNSKSSNGSLNKESKVYRIPIFEDSGCDDDDDY